MNTKHTPGPWVVTDSGVRDSGGYICFTIKPTRYPCQDERYEKELAERKANARLIAAAPDLLAALQAAVNHSFGDFTMPSKIEAAARAAIEKATGAVS